MERLCGYKFYGPNNYERRNKVKDLTFEEESVLVRIPICIVTSDEINLDPQVDNEVFPPIQIVADTVQEGQTPNS